MDKNYDCCDANGDVRGLCFICIGDLTKMTKETITHVRKCLNKEYAVAYWIYNNFNDEWEKNKLTWFMKMKELKKLQVNWKLVEGHIGIFIQEDAQEEDVETDEFTCECCDDYLKKKWFARHDCGCKLICEKCITRHDQECEDYIEQQKSL